MSSHTLYFFYNNSPLHGHENKRILILKSSILIQKKIERKGGARFLAFSICIILLCVLGQWLASRTTDQGVPGSRPGRVASLWP